MSRLLMSVVLAMFATLAPAFAAFAPNRIVTAVDVAAKTFSCQAGPGEASDTYITTSKTKIRISGKKVRLSYLWNGGHLSDLKIGAVVTVQYHVDQGNRIAERVAIYPKKSPKGD